MIILVNTYDGNINKAERIECTDDFLSLIQTIIEHTNGNLVELKCENDMLLCLVYKKETQTLIKQIEYAIFNNKKNSWLLIKK